METMDSVDPLVGNHIKTIRIQKREGATKKNKDAESLRSQFKKISSIRFTTIHTYTP